MLNYATYILCMHIMFFIQSAFIERFHCVTHCIYIQCLLRLCPLSLENLGSSKLPTPICYVDKEGETYVRPKGIILFKTLKGQ